MKRLVDLHTHTIYSDGELSPGELLNRCKTRNVTTVAITDHNEIAGAKEAIWLNPYKDITVIPGIEFSSAYELKHGDLHILGYNIDLENKALNDITANIRLENIARIENIISALAKYNNITFKEEDIANIFKRKGNIGRPEVAKLLIKYGYSKTVQDAFDSFLIPLEDYLPKRKYRLNAKETIEYILNAGGIACLAHPFTLRKNYNELKVFVKELMSYGICGIEVHHGDQDKAYQKEMLNLANELGLLVSCGSDFHGPNVTPNTEVGSGINNNLNFEYVSILSKLMR